MKGPRRSSKARDRAAVFDATLAFCSCHGQEIDACIQYFVAWWAERGAEQATFSDQQREAPRRMTARYDPLVVPEQQSSKVLMARGSCKACKFVVKSRSSERYRI